MKYCDYSYTKKSYILLWIALVFYAVSQIKITGDYPFLLYHREVLAGRELWSSPV